MATDQGKTSNMNALAAVSGVLGRSVEDVGHTTFRPPYTPVTFGAFAGASRGDLFDPVRQTPLHAWAVARGAVFENVGTWQRARYFPRGGEDMHQAVARECHAVRNAAGIFDGSTLGKIEVTGPDAGEFLSRMYIHGFNRLAPGRCRYSMMLSEAGYVMDDGVVARLAADRFHVTTTTGAAASVLDHLEDYRQTEFPDLRVWLTSTTEQWAVIAVQGPRAHQVIAPLVQGVDLATMPHMSMREARICGVPVRLFRVSFTGEVGYEVNCTGRSWSRLVGCGVCSRWSVRHYALWHGGDARAARREGLYHCRTGDRWHGHPLGSWHCSRSAARLRRQAIAWARRYAARRSQAACWIAGAGGPGGRRAGCR